MAECERTVESVVRVISSSASPERVLHAEHHQWSTGESARVAIPPSSPVSSLLLSSHFSSASLPLRILPLPSHTWSIDHRFRFTHPALPLSSVDDDVGGVMGVCASTQVGPGGG
jgi:hypothetical protein